jgi:transposase
MSGFIEGQCRTQVTLFPESLDEYVAEDNEVRAIDVFIDELDLSAIGFRMEPSATGRPAYHPRTMLKLYVYGYLNRVQSSRRLEREAQRNIELMWLTGRLAPDFKTIADFRKNNGEAIRAVCREFVMLCRKLGLFVDAVVAIDGSKFKGVNNRNRNFTKAKLKGRLRQIDESIERYLGEIASEDRRENRASQGKRKRLSGKIEALKKEMAQLKEMEDQVLSAPDQQISLTDPDARAMTSAGRGKLVVGYNLQAAVDTKNHLIVAHEVTNDGLDCGQLSNMAKQAKEAIGSETLEVVADRGYYDGSEVLACEEAGVTAYLPKPQTSGNKAKGLFARRDFVYDPEHDHYRCPAGEIAIYRYSREENGKVIRRYWSSACTTCSIKDKCTTGAQRRIGRWEHEAVLEALEERLDNEPERMKARRQTVEHPFGTLKAWMGVTPLLTRTLGRVSTEVSLSVLAYNFRRLLTMFGTQQLIGAIRA